MLERISIAVTHHRRCTSGARRPSSWDFQGHCISKGWGVRGKGGVFVEPNVEGRRVLYGVPDKEGMSNVLDGFSEIFQISRVRDEFLPGLSEKGVYQTAIAHLELSTDNARPLRCYPIRRCNRVNTTRHLPSTDGIGRTTVKLHSSATQISP